MHISLPTDLEQFIEDRVKAGQFDNPGDVVLEALRTLRFQHEALPHGKDLERLIAEGQQEADRGEWLDGEDVLQTLLSRNAQRPRP